MEDSEDDTDSQGSDGDERNGIKFAESIVPCSKDSIEPAVAAVVVDGENSNSSGVVPRRKPNVTSEYEGNYIQKVAQYRPLFRNSDTELDAPIGQSGEKRRVGPETLRNESILVPEVGPISTNKDIEKEERIRLTLMTKEFNEVQLKENYIGPGLEEQKRLSPGIKLSSRILSIQEVEDSVNSYVSVSKSPNSANTCPSDIQVTSLPGDPVSIQVVETKSTAVKCCEYVEQKTLYSREGNHTSKNSSSKKEKGVV